MPTGKEDFKAKPRTVNRLKFRNRSLFELFTISVKVSVECGSESQSVYNINVVRVCVTVCCGHTLLAVTVC